MGGEQAYINYTKKTSLQIMNMAHMKMINHVGDQEKDRRSESRQHADPVCLDAALAYAAISRRKQDSAEEIEACIDRRQTRNHTDLRRTIAMEHAIIAMAKIRITA